VISTWHKFLKKGGWGKVGMQTRLDKFIFGMTKTWNVHWVVLGHFCSREKLRGTLVMVI